MRLAGGPAAVCCRTAFQAIVDRLAVRMEQLAVHFMELLPAPLLALSHAGLLSDPGLCGREVLPAGHVFPHPFGSGACPTYIVFVAMGSAVVLKSKCLWDAACCFDTVRLALGLIPGEWSLRSAAIQPCPHFDFLAWFVRSIFVVCSGKNAKQRSRKGRYPFSQIVGVGEGIAFDGWHYWTSHLVGGESAIDNCLNLICILTQESPPPP